MASSHMGFFGPKEPEKSPFPTTNVPNVMPGGQLAGGGTSGGASGPSDGYGSGQSNGGSFGAPKK